MSIAIRPTSRAHPSSRLISLRLKLGILLGTVATLVGLVAARRIAEPLLALARALRSIRQDGARVPLPRSSTTEVAWLADELDAMRTALDAHTVEMRTALAELSRYRLLAERLNDAVLFVDRDGTIVEANPAAVAMYGYDRADLIGRPVYDLLGGTEDRLGAAALEHAHRESLNFESTHRRHDGTTFPAEVTLIGTQGADGSTAGPRAAVVRDISARQAVEASRARLLVREQEARAHEERAAEVTGILQHMPCSVLVFDRDGCLTLANERALELLSLDEPPDEQGDALLGRSLVPTPRCCWSTICSAPAAHWSPGRSAAASSTSARSRSNRPAPRI